MVANKETLYTEYNNMKKDIQNNLNVLNKKLPIEIYIHKYYYLFYNARSTFDTLYTFDSKIVPIIDHVMEKAIKIHRKELDFEETRVKLAEDIAEKFLYPYIDRDKNADSNTETKTE